MAQTSRTEIVDVKINKLYDVIIDFAKYPEFVDGVSAIKVLSQNEKEAKVEYSLNVIKTFKYIINTKMERPTKVSWVLDSEPQIHEKIYKISWGPSWIKEYIGGSERIKYLGASERFLGASEIFIGSSEIFIESSYRLLKGIEHNYPGGSEMFLGSSELIPIGSSDKN